MDNEIINEYSFILIWTNSSIKVRVLNFARVQTHTKSSLVRFDFLILEFDFRTQTDLLKFSLTFQTIQPTSN